MTDRPPTVLNGFLEEDPVPGAPHGSTARFRLTLSPTDERTDETLLPCRVTEPVMAAAVLHDLVPGDQLRVTGDLCLPRTPDEPLWLAVAALEVLQTALVLADTSGADSREAAEHADAHGYCPDGDLGQVLVMAEHHASARRRSAEA